MSSLKRKAECLSSPSPPLALLDDTTLSNKKHKVALNPTSPPLCLRHYAAKWCFEVGLSMRDGKKGGHSKNKVKAVFWVQKAATLGLDEAQSELGFCYQFGDGVAQDEVKGVAWYLKAAQQGHAGAQFNVSQCYQNAKGVDEDDEQYVYWLQKAAEQGLDTAQVNLGACYGNGYGVDQDEDKAIVWHQKAMDQKNVYGYVNMALRYLQGRGVKQDLHRALSLLETATLLVENEDEQRALDGALSHASEKKAQQDAFEAQFGKVVCQAHRSRPTLVEQLSIHMPILDLVHIVMDYLLHFPTEDQIGNYYPTMPHACTQCTSGWLSVEPARDTLSDDSVEETCDTCDFTHSFPQLVSVEV